MEKVDPTPSFFSKPVIYRIILQGRITATLIQTIDNMQIRAQEEEEMINLVGWLPDQAALIGMLNALHNIHFAILSVELLTVTSGSLAEIP